MVLSRERILARDLHQAVREICLWLPEAEEFVSHGAPNFRVRGKTFATYTVNHHGDGRVALWLNAAAGSQELHVRAEPEHFFVPPYVGPRGWLGVVLDRGLAWKQVAALVREAYEKVAPNELRSTLGKTPAFKAPGRKLRASEIDPMKSPRAAGVLKTLRKVCLRLPESREDLQFGHPVWQAGKKTFAMARHDAGRLTLCFWVGVDRQGLLTADSRYRIPPYMGHNGWIALDVSSGCDWQEVAGLALQSYRHFALKRMLLRLPPQ
jgi:predicted DNA-binding protein (MmcQ/YjbR family)